MERPSQPAAVVLERLRRATMFPPGYFARHSGWGIGRIRENDTENILVDFPAKPMHRMSYATAEKALEPLAAEDLRVLLAVDPARVERLRREVPAEIVALALATLKKGEGSVDDLRRALVPAVLPSTAWAGWWKGARTAVAGDARIDSRRAYENVYRLSGGDEESEEVQLPGWDVKRDLSKNLAALDMFLAHHPRQRDRVMKPTKTVS
jgi:transcription elongation factor GreA-like protein